MSVPFVAVESTILENGIQIPHFLFGIGEVPAVVGNIAFITPGKENKGANSRAQRTHTAHQQRKYVEQASASSGNQWVLGHRSVPRFEIVAPDDSTNGGRALFGVLARLANATIPEFQQEKQHAIST